MRFAFLRGKGSVQVNFLRMREVGEEATIYLFSEQAKRSLEWEGHDYFMIER